MHYASASSKLQAQRATPFPVDPSTPCDNDGTDGRHRAFTIRRGHDTWRVTVLTQVRRTLTLPGASTPIALGDP